MAHLYRVTGWRKGVGCIGAYTASPASLLVRFAVGQFDMLTCEPVRAPRTHFAKFNTWADAIDHLLQRAEDLSADADQCEQTEDLHLARAYRHESASLRVAAQVLRRAAGEPTNE